jgi:hypothetical protein
MAGRNGLRALGTALLALAVSACGGGQPQAATRAPEPPPADQLPEDQPPEAQPPEDTAANESQPPAPAASEAGSRTFDERERALLCGPAPLTASAASFDAVLQQVQEGDRALTDKAARARAATEAGCRDAVDALDNVFQQLSASSRTLCDYQFARGIGVTGDELVARTNARLTAIDDRVAAIAGGDDKACQVQAKRLAADVESWRGQREGICVLTAEQKAVSSCGVEASDAGQKQRAKSYCDALAANGVADTLLARPLEQCVGQALRAVP